MKKIVNLCLILAVGVMATSCNCLAKNVDDVVITCNPEVLTLKGNNVITDVTVSFPEKYYNKKAIAKVTPVLEFEGGSIVGTPQYFQGSKVKDNYIVIDKKTGGSYTISVSIPYDPRAEISTLVMVVEGRCKGKDTEMTEVARIPVAEGINTLQNKVNYASALELMSDKYEKTTVISEKANILYTINQSNVRKNQLTTEQIKALEAFITENVDKDRVTLGSVYANGYASPDGPLALNDKLSKARSESGKKEKTATEKQPQTTRKNTSRRERACGYVELAGILGQPMGIGLNAGGYISRFNIEAYGSYGLGSKTLYSTDGAAYKVAPFSYGARLGYAFGAGNSFAFTPQLGVGGLTVYGEGVRAMATTVSLGVRCELFFTKNIGMSIAPEYVYGIKSDTMKQLTSTAPSVGKWCSGFAARVGLYFNF